MNQTRLTPYKKIKIGVLLIFSLVLFCSSCSLSNRIFHPDSDNDGVENRKDKCPNTQLSGFIDSNGCLDTDKDGIPDHLDSCPNQTGLANFNGCADTDGDSIPDKDDACPFQKGDINFNGCPDSDGDGIADTEDLCPDIRGLLLLNGCPDKDGDGISDHQDKCPDVPGTKSNGGCPENLVLSFDMTPIYLPESLPAPSSHTILGKTIFDGCKTYADINEKLLRVLTACGYDGSMYFLIKNGGFVIQTKLEQIDERGVPLSPEYRRWSIEVPGAFSDGFSLRKIFQAIVKESSGHYRIFLFVVTANVPSIISGSDQFYSYDLKEVIQFNQTGMTGLPSILGREKISPSEVNCQVFIYHFVNHEIEFNANLIKMDKITAINHLKQAGIWELLRKK